MKTLSLKEAAEFLRLSADALRDMAVAGKVPGAQLGPNGGRIWIFTDESLFGNRRRKKQLEQQGKLTQQQVEANKQLMDYGHAQQLDMWEKTNYPAQVAMMKEAGLNPAMMYD